MKNNLPTLSKTVFVSCVVAGVLTLAIPLSRTFVHAQELRDMNQQLVMSAIPPRTETMKVKKGETQQFSVRLKNMSQTPITVSSFAQDFIVADDGKTPTPVSERDASTLRWSLASWLTVSPNEALIEPMESQMFSVIMQVPSDAIAGGHYAMILHRPLTEVELITEDESADSSIAQGSASTTHNRVGTLVYVEVDGIINENAVVQRLSAPQLSEFGPVPVSFEIENLSDTHIQPKISMTVKNLFGKVSQEGTVETANIFPYSARAFSSSFDKTWGFGPYTTTITAGYGSHGKVVSASTVFWIIPYRLLLALLVVFVSGVAIVVAIRRHLTHKNSIQQQEIEILEERLHQLENELKHSEK